VLVGEIGASQAILRAGYNIAVLMRFWADADFRVLPDPCERSRGAAFSGDVDPLQIGIPTERIGMKGERVAIEPTEVLFVKSKGHNRPHTPKMLALLAWENTSSGVRWERQHAQTARQQILYTNQQS